MRVLITGHRGFVGRWFWRTLDTPDNELVGVDVKTGVDCRWFFANDTGPRFDLVLHCAAVVGGRATIEREPMKVATDLAIDSDMFQWALRTGPGRVVYFSSSAAYPARLQDPTHAPTLLTEDDVVPYECDEPDAVYGWVKLTGERLAALTRAEGVPVTVVRPFSGYGPDQDLTYPFPAFIRRACERQDPFPIWGPGTQSRDWVHVSDVVGATLEAVKRGVDGPVNLCTGRATTFLDLADLVSDAAGYDPQLAPDSSAPTGVHHRVGDPALMSTFYKSAVTLEAGVADAVHRHRGAPPCST